MYVCTASELEIKSLVVQHGNVTHPIAFLPVSADKLAVWGKRDKNWFIGKGIRSDKIEITGCLKFQNLPLKSKEKIFHDIGLDTDKRLVTYTMDYSKYGVLFANYHLLLHNQIDIIKNLSYAFNDVTDVQLLIKLHPDDPYFHFLKREAVKMFKNNKNLNITKDLNIREILAYSDLLISRISSTILEAVLLGKPALIYNPTHRPDVMSYIKEDFLKEIKSFEDLKKCVSLDDYSRFLIKDRSLLNEYINFDNSLNGMCRLMKELLN